MPNRHNNTTPQLNSPSKGSHNNTTTTTAMSDERVPWEESNLSEIGSELDKKIREAAAQNEAQWGGDVGQEPGLKVWRIEKFQVVPWPEDKIGHFHVGDSYIVLNSYLVQDSDKLCHDIYIWIGSESSQDEYGTAAYKMVEADDSLGGIAVQHRQVQGHESDLFQSYFGNKITYLAGGVDSGFRRVESTVEEPHLYKVKGTEKAMSLTQVPVTRASLNSGDCFILVLGSNSVHVWHGAKSNQNERIRANTLAEGMATEATVTVLDQDEGDEEATEFWNHLGGHAKDIAPGDDDADDQVTEFTPTLYRLPGNDSGGGAAPELIAKGELVKIGWSKNASFKIAKSLLDTNNVFLLDAGWELFVWMGKESDRSERLAAMNHVDAYGKFMPRAKHLPVSIIKEGYETSAFDGYFIKE